MSSTIRPALQGRMFARPACSLYVPLWGICIKKIYLYPYLEFWFLLILFKLLCEFSLSLRLPWHDCVWGYWRTFLFSDSLDLTFRVINQGSESIAKGVHFLLSFSSQNASRQEAPSEGSHVRVGGAPVTCITLVNENVWCGCANNVVILDGK